VSRHSPDLSIENKLSRGYTDEAVVVLRNYFSATKWDWLINECEEVKQARSQGRLKIGTVESWLVHVKLSLFHLCVLSPSLTSSDIPCE
jgi:glycerol kinase